MAEFTGKRYITSGVENEIPIELQIVMWDMIDENRQQGKDLDYLQVFQLKSTYVNGVEMQEITYSQEQPRRKKKITIKSDSPVSEKIFVIDDITHSTMLLCHEY